MYLGFQSQITTRAGVDFAIRADARTYRAINDAHNPPLLWEMKRALPRCLFGLRLVRDVDLYNYEQAALEFWQALRPKLEEFPYDFVSGANEIGYRWPDSSRYSLFTAALAEHVHAWADVWKPELLYGGYDWGVGWPDLSELNYYRAGWVSSDRIFMHLYHLHHQDDADTLGRARDVQEETKILGFPERQIWATELGLDRAGEEGDGWNGPTWMWKPENYGLWLDMQARELPDVEHGIVFLGEETDPRWRSWRIVGEGVIADAMARANKAEDERRAQIMPELHGRAAAMAAAIGDTSMVLTGPVYMTPDTFYQRTERFTYTWTRGDDMGIAGEHRFRMGADGVLVEIPNPSGPII